MVILRCGPVCGTLRVAMQASAAVQNEHERVAKGGYDSNGEMSSAPEPMGVAYGKKIGVGGFGAVYEGEWSGRQVAIKVRHLVGLRQHAVAVMTLLSSLR